LSRYLEFQVSEERFQSDGQKGSVDDAKGMVGKMQQSATVERLAE
jgi:hypothetical protein